MRRKEQILESGANTSKQTETKKPSKETDKEWSEIGKQRERMEPNKEDFPNEGVTRGGRCSSEVQEGTVHF